MSDLTQEQQQQPSAPQVEPFNKPSMPLKLRPLAWFIAWLTVISMVILMLVAVYGLAMHARTLTTFAVGLVGLAFLAASYNVNVFALDNAGSNIPMINGVPTFTDLVEIELITAT